jgi:Putative zinc-finger
MKTQMKTLSCKHAVRLISDYLAHDLSNSEEREVRAHLVLCENCRRLADEFVKSSSLLAQALTPPEFDAGFYSGIRTAVISEIARERESSPFSFLRRRWLYASAFAALVVVGALMLQHAGAFGTRRKMDSAVASQSGQPDLAAETIIKASPSPPLANSLEKAAKRSETQESVSNRIGRHPTGRPGDRQFAAARERDGSSMSKPVADKRSETALALRSATNTGTSESEAADHVSRIEIQTSDPNIRIIWLVPQSSGASDGANHDQDRHENGNLK